MSSTLIVFVRHPELGKVKTRLAKSIGDEEALKVYKFLLRHTREIIEPLKIPIFIYYSEHLVQNDIWEGEKFHKRIQSGEDLGKRMYNAFSEILMDKYSKVLIIGSDCYELNKEIIEEGFNKLDNCDVVIGAARDGGYYLLGMKRPLPELFENKKWSSNSVFEDTIRDIKQLRLSVDYLPVLTDVDEEKDITFSYY